jgi:aspartyl-tRNA(Asn)/glutamyl-tRNA(Gln) amidotransferase subunit A
VGVKPTYGRVSRYGLVAYASSLDQVGPFARTVADAALLLEVLAGHDPRDSTCVDQPVPRYSQTVDLPVQDLRVGVPREFFGEGLDAEVERAIRVALKEYEKQGAKLVDVSLPHSRFAIATYHVVATAGRRATSRYDGMHYGHRTAINGDLIATYCRRAAKGSVTKRSGGSCGTFAVERVQRRLLSESTEGARLIK